MFSRLQIVLAPIVLALCLQPAAHAADACSGMHAGSNTITVTSGGERYRVELTLADSFEPSARNPLVIGLHPSGGSGTSFNRDTELGTSASAKGFATIFPDGGIQLPRDGGGNGHYWNVPGVPLVSGSAVPDGARNDVQFIADVIDHVVKNNCIDARRVFVTGFSGGARMSSALACRLADRVTAVAPVAGLRAGRAAAPDFAEPDTSDCRPSRPLSVLAIHGTSDGTNPFPGGEGVRWGYSIERATERWAALDRCGSSPATEQVASHITRISYGACRASSEVLLFKIDAPANQGGGHVWPRSAEFSATERVLEFFSRH